MRYNLSVNCAVGLLRHCLEAQHVSWRHVGQDFDAGAHGEAGPEGRTAHIYGHLCELALDLHAGARLRQE